MASACMGRCMEHVSEWVQPRCRSGRRASGSASAPWGAMHVHRQLCRLLGVRAAPRSHSATRLTTLPPRAYWRQERGAPSGLHHAPIRRQCRRTSGTGAGGNSGLLSTSLAFIGIRPVRAEAATAHPHLVTLSEGVISAARSPARWPSRWTMPSTIVKSPNHAHDWPKKSAICRTRFAQRTISTRLSAPAPR
jgi:hypothetical protein